MKYVSKYLQKNQKCNMDWEEFSVTILKRNIHNLSKALNKERRYSYGQGMTTTDCEQKRIKPSINELRDIDIEDNTV